ncbi:structural maintenance of chromosomes flexible hinge domain-containing protein 1-like [Acropora millepora]|uniref:structural maintenance of chromosomes flexible hinge domain-containing protein 1-like n=1 Tax=Acropora millepora TaxID=45264 RepID=UPI001CF5478C|nr:structural maintenance of chromosomes flexible hinge domain-containing protein 1-like [Acropora millepora]
MKSSIKDEASPENDEEDAAVFIYDRRAGSRPQEKVQLGGIFNFTSFKEKSRQAFNIPADEEFVIVTTNRKEISDDKAYEELVDGNETLYILQHAAQELSAPTEERVEYIPHYDTLVKSGMYEYYASEGQNPLPFAFAELVDNALTATAENLGTRKIEIRLMFDESVGKPVVCIVDNGGGMTSKELNNWAIYRLSKFNRQNGRKMVADLPRSLNSDISYFGVGGKQAIFFIGDATRMITKSKDCNDIHELCISQAEFERREKMRESIYGGAILNRRAGDHSHVPADEANVKQLVEEEVERNSFTCVVISGIKQERMVYLRTHFKQLCRQLSHIYHYYIHGPRGNDFQVGRARTASPFRNIDIQVVLYEKGKQPKRMELRDVNDDLQTRYIRTAASVFEFRANSESGGVVEGILRYHPFLYDRETYPSLEGEFPVVVETGEEFAEAVERDSRAPRGSRPIFECYWNGRLIPYTTIDVLDWCQPPKKSTIPLECYNRFSGCLWTNDSFHVSTNKLTFMDLEVKIRDKNTMFSRVILGQEQRVNISRAFQDWVRECHENHDKQVQFIDFQGQIKRPDLPQKRNQSPWCVFNSIEWDGKIFKVGQLIRTQRTVPLICGTVKRFLLFGDHDGDVFATGGEMEIVQEPVSLYGDRKFFSLAKLDRSITLASIKKFVDDEEAKLPSKLIIEWPEQNKLEHNSKIPAGTTIGAMRVDILNGKGESVNKLPGDRKRLLVELKVIWHGTSMDKDGDKIITNHVCQHGGKSWPYWFRKMENITHLGPHTLQLQVLLSDSSTAPSFKSLPCHRIKFTVTEAHPNKFTVGMLETPLRVGVPFQIPLNLLDVFNNPSKLSKEISPVLSASGLELTHQGTIVKVNSLVVKGVVALGSVPSHAGKDFNLKITLPGLAEGSQSLKIRLLPGPPESLAVTPGDAEITVENNSSLQLQVQVQDKAGNVTVHPRLNVVCKLTGLPSLPTYSGDCSSSGKATLTGADICLKHITKETRLKAKIELQHHKEVTPVEKTIIVTPSSKAAELEVFYKPVDAKQGKKLEDGQELACTAGQTLTGLTFKVRDEGQREVVIDSLLANRFKVNWTPKVSKDLIKQGILPDVKAPLSSDESKYCQVSMTGGAGLEFSFTLRPHADVPSVLKCSCHNPYMRLGETLAADIILSVTDKHGNKTGKLPSHVLPEFHVSSDGLRESEVQLGFTADGNIVVKNIQFEEGPLGHRELAIKWKEMICYQRIEVISGPPAKLKILDLDHSEPISVFNDTQMPHPLTVQLCDKLGNHSDEANIKVVLNCDRGLKLTPTPAQQKTDTKGQATFGHLTVSAAKGMYGIRIKALLGRISLDAPTVNVRVDPDPSKAVNLCVTFDSKAPCVVGELLPALSAHVVGEDDAVMKPSSSRDIVLKIWHSKDGPVSDKPPARATTLYPSKSKSTDKDGEFYFRDLKVPDLAGDYCMVVQFGSEGQVTLSSKPITFTAKAGRPMKLEPESIPATPTVSNTQRNNSRLLVKTLKLQLKDKFDNLTGENLKGKVVISVNSSSEGIDEIPALAGNLYSTEVPLVKGVATVQNLLIQENTAGKDGQEYLLNFSAQIPANASPHPIPPFTLAFLFYNDVRKQQQMAQLTKERDHLFETIRTYRLLFETTRQLINEMQVSVNEASLQEQKIRGELRKQNIGASSLASVASVTSLITELSRKRDEISTTPRRQCLLHPGPRGDSGILGKVAHLAQVVDDDVARVLSWHMASDMDCVVTLTTEKAKQVYRDSKGQQQVLPLDSIFRRSLPEWNRSLPHVRGNQSSYSPAGNPVYARDMLLFPTEADNCKLVFGMLLGDTLILDDLDCANKYRQEVVKYTHCPTILTRCGDRIRSNGKFGGLQNKAPQLERMRGAVFAAPLPLAFHSLSTQIEQLQAYKQASIKHTQAKEELTQQLQHGQTEEMKVKHRECREAENQLRLIEERLGMTPTQYNMPPSPATMLLTEINTPPTRTSVSRRSAARAAAAATASPTLSSAPVVNGTNTSSSNTSPRTRRGAPIAPEEVRSSKRTRR